ncbi:acetyl-CoA carboxylase biotin carboxylase subunit [Porticoccaceae bacterium]|nr:acetyl-CoA carboxylase biotin carboxylase subunit [Porticoccaceae bacterium]MDA8936386.1 acetyl-CoA carboxylase biotin carboxylase subunit [Porticoccaceae bacterium]MDB2549837.1 acetyl-CoA carboxylase biotin carboxylase subunit [Porticoccaceae bacterium]
MKPFNSILIANRGEIACRVIRTAKQLGYRTIAVYSEADAGAPHMQLADAAVCIGPGPVGESYLLADNILAAAASSGAEAIHPGYGFLSENAAFAEAVESAGLVFIGPTREAIDVMGNKAESKRRMIDAGVPCVPGYEGLDQSDKTLLAEGNKIDLPLMVKAAAGGGGRGMRLVHDYKELANAIKLARAEAESAFGSGELILEKAIIQPRHVEIQVFADTQGNTIHLGERDCSVQRRHQKVVEEAPCPIMTPELREQMGQSAIDAAKSVNYRGAGTVEFLLDSSGAFYFLEMNTRLQVEHPVTELITGLDLVELQINVAQGQPLGLTQEDIKLQGAAIEVRLYTEDPSQDFLPASGPVDLWQPASGVGVRIDGGISTGQAISPFYDPMVAKVIGYGADRETARLRLIDALKETVLFGTANNKDFLIQCLEKQRFIDGAATTAFIAEEFNETDLAVAQPSVEDAAAAAVIDLNLEYQRHFARSTLSSHKLKNWTMASGLVSRKQYQFGESLYDLSISPLANSPDTYLVSCAQSQQQVEIQLLTLEGQSASLLVNDSTQLATFKLRRQGQLYCSIAGRSAMFKDQIILDGAVDEAVGGGRVVAPMHGLLLEVLVKPGDQVLKGQNLAVLEAMKMHYEIIAEVDGTVEEVTAVAGNQVAADDVLIEIQQKEAH